MKSGTRLLLVEDHADTANVFSHVLRLYGFHVDAVASAADALAICQTQTFDLLIADINIPTEGGKSFTLDGVLGMNYFVASAEVSGGLMPDIGKIVDGPFRWIVIDLKQSELGLEPRVDH